MLKYASPFCKACKDAGEPWHVYESHFTKDTRGKVYCPIILNNRCNKCNLTGHFPKYCPATKPLDLRFLQKKTSFQPPPALTQNTPPSENIFSLLDLDEDILEDIISPPQRIPSPDLDLESDLEPSPPTTPIQTPYRSNISWADYDDEEEDLTTLDDISDISEDQEDLLLLPFSYVVA
jgi:hypothetical protein